MKEKLGIYIHIPFCKSKCQYCDFYSTADWPGQRKDYQRALLTHMRETAPLAESFEVDTVYFGGGTPSIYGEKELRELLGAVKKYYKLLPGAEITLEANPDSAEERSLRRLRRAGFNRLSLGMQSALDEELQAMGRAHTMEQTRRAVAAGHKAGFKNISLDLIYGYPGQTLESWQHTVQSALDLAPQHLSCYGLKVEPGTPLHDRVLAGEAPVDEDRQADFYLWTAALLSGLGYEQYEISNFAQPGFFSRHNLRYWLGQPYIGFGPGAHSDFGARRYSFVRDLDQYLAGVLGGGPLLDEDELIPYRERSGEYLMLRLRTAQGVEEWEYQNKYFQDFTPLEERLKEFSAQGWAEKTAQGRWRLTPAGFLLSNQLIGDLLTRQTQPHLAHTLARAKQRNARHSPSPGEP